MAAGRELQQPGPASACRDDVAARHASAQVDGCDVLTELARLRKGRRAQLALVRLEPEVHRRDVLPQVIRLGE